MQEINKYLKFNDDSIHFLKKFIEKIPHLVESSDKNKSAQDCEDDLKQFLQSVEKVEFKPSKKGNQIKKSII